MRMLQIIGAAVVLLASPAMAKENGPARWTVTQASGDVRVVRNGLQPASLQVRASLAPGDVVATGATGRVVLVRGGDYVVVAPGSRLLLPKQETSGFTRLLQQVGTMLYKVQHTGVPHFEVKTPLLAAVVKGTSFTVVVDDKRAAVQVTDGLVEVSSADGAARQLVEKGVTVYVGHDRPGAIVTVGPATSIEKAPSADSVKVASSGEVTVAAIADLSGGLVTATTVAPSIKTAAKPVTSAPALATAADTVDAGDTNGRGGAPVVTNVTAPAVKSPVAPVVGLVTTSPAVSPLTPVVDVVTTSPAVVAPVVTTPTVTSPVAVIAPVLTTPVATVSPTVTAPVVTPVTTVTAPIVTAVPVVTAPIVTTVPVVTAPVVTAPVVTAPVVTAPIVTPIPVVTTPVLPKAPVVTIPAVTPGL